MDDCADTGGSRMPPAPIDYSFKPFTSPGDT
jgi:hypothetical protein